MKQREAADVDSWKTKHHISERNENELLLKFLCFDSEQFLLAHAESVCYIAPWALDPDNNNIECNKIGVT